MAWLDLENAFGLVPTEHLLGSMEELGLNGSTVEVVRDIYTGPTMRVKIGKAHSEEIQCYRGVKQGCPLSLILFDLALEQLVSGLENGRESGYTIRGEEKVATLAYVFAGRLPGMITDNVGLGRRLCQLGWIEVPTQQVCHPDDQQQGPQTLCGERQVPHRK